MAAKKSARKTSKKTSAKATPKTGEKSDKPNKTQRPTGSGASKKKSAKKAAKKTAAKTTKASAKKAPKKAAPKKSKPAKDKPSSLAVNMGHVFSLRPRVEKSFRPGDFSTAKHLLQDESYADLREAARAVAEKALELTHDGPGHGRRH